MENIIHIEKPYLLFVNDAKDEMISAKTAFGLFYWRKDLCIGQLANNNAKVELPLPKLTIEDAIKKGCKTLIIGIANFGGSIEKSWIPILVEAMKQGLHIASGLHEKLTNYKEISDAAQKYNRNIYEIRHLTINGSPATGKKRTGKRLLTVGTDCGVGKMFTALAITKEMKKYKLKVDFRATGQTGIFIADYGIPFDAIKVDFVTGAVEQLTPDNSNDHWDIIEGQGSILHPGTGVVLSLIHGSQPDALVLCHEASRKTLYNYPDYEIPDINKCIEANLDAARITNKK